jgi:hypothetical protein
VDKINNNKLEPGYKRPLIRNGRGNKDALLQAGNLSAQCTGRSKKEDVEIAQADTHP